MALEPRAGDLTGEVVAVRSHSEQAKSQTRRAVNIGSTTCCLEIVHAMQSCGVQEVCWGTALDGGKEFEIERKGTYKSQS
jgi:hypothetical protein